MAQSVTVHGSEQLRYKIVKGSVILYDGTFILSTNSKEQAQDITQEIFLIAYEKGKDFLEHEKTLAFLYTTARNLVYCMEVLLRKSGIY